MSKGPEAFRTISEVASDLDLPQHVLRFWETRFAQIRPMKRGGGRRYYRPEDIELLRGIRHLLYSEGYTIRGVQRILRDQGPRFVSAVGKGEADPATSGPEHGGASSGAEDSVAEHAQPYHRESARPRRFAARVQNGGETPAGTGGLTREEVRRLQSTLLELLECKRLLDQTR